MANRQKISPNGNKSVNRAKTVYWSWLGSMVALIVPLGYILAYIHEIGFCDFFKIPKELIQLNWTITLIAVTGVIGGVLVLGGIIYIPFLFKKGIV